MNFMTKMILGNIVAGAGIYLITKGLDKTIDYLEKEDIEKTIDDVEKNIDKTVKNVKTNIKKAKDKAEDVVEDVADKVKTEYHNKIEKIEEIKARYEEQMKVANDEVERSQAKLEKIKKDYNEVKDWIEEKYNELKK